MIDIRPVSDLKDHFSEIEAAVSEGSSVYLTKNGYVSMIITSVEQRGISEKQLEDLLDLEQYQAAKEAYEKDPATFTLEEVEEELGL